MSVIVASHYVRRQTIVQLFLPYYNGDYIFDSLPFKQIEQQIQTMTSAFLNYVTEHVSKHFSSPGEGKKVQECDASKAI